MDKLTFGIIGAGCVAQNYAEAFLKCSNAKVVAIVDTNFQAASMMATRLECSCFTSIEEMCGSTKPNAVIICTPPHTHESICMYFLEQGIHVCCEKPLATNSQSARRMIASARRFGVILTMASKFRHVADVIVAESLVKSGVIGEVGLYENAFMSEVDMSQRWNCIPHMSGGGVLIDNGTHSVDIMRYLLGPVASVRVVEGTRRQNLPVEETVHICARNSEGIVGRIDLSWSTKASTDTFIRLHGSQGMIEIGWKESRYRCSLSPDWVVFGNGYNKCQAFVNQIDDFCASIIGKKTLRVNDADMLASVDVIEAGYHSLRSGGWFFVKDVIPQAWKIHSSQQLHWPLESTKLAISREAH